MDRHVKNSMPSIRGIPLIGNLIDFRYNRLSLLEKVSRECGDIGKFQVGPTEVILLNAPKYIRKAFIEHAYSFRKPGAMAALVRPVIGNGLYINEGEGHIQQRKQITPIFQHRNITQFADIIAEYSEQTQQGWSTGNTIDITNEMMRLIMRIIGVVLFNRDISQESDKMRNNLEVISRHINDKISSLLPISTAYPTKQNRIFKNAISYMESIIQRIIDDARTSNKSNDDMLSMLLQTQMTDRQIRDEIMNLFFAGYETTALAVIWTWYLLTQHPEIYKRMQDEIDNTLSGRKPTYADLQKLPFTLQILKESLRLYPPAYLLVRKALHQVELEEYSIPPGRVIAVSPYVLHRRVEYFDNPNEFHPSRFADQEQNQAYIPFGIGPRTCLGNHFALMEAQIILVVMAQTITFRLLPGQNITPIPLTTLYPNDAIKMKIERR